MSLWKRMFGSCEINTVYVGCKDVKNVPVYQTMWNSIDSLVTMLSYTADESLDVEMALHSQFPSYTWQMILRNPVSRTVNGPVPASYGFKGTLNPIVDSKKKGCSECRVHHVHVKIIRVSAMRR